MKIEEIAFEAAEPFRENCDLLLLTATRVEHHEVLAKLRPLNKESAVYCVFKGNLTYYIGSYGAYGAVLVKSGMGAGGADGALLSTRNAIELWQPKAVVMVGIAFGVDPKSQRIGDVLISDHIIPYDLKREGRKVRVFRSEHPPASSFLKNRFEEVLNWSFRLPGGQLAKKKICPLLSGEVLVDNEAFRNALIEEFPQAKGGEMEGRGVYAAANDKAIPWIVVKAICDFADGNKGQNKAANQEVAIQSANSLVHKVFSSPYAFEDLQMALSGRSRRE
ncbi:MAG: hypothetical protein AAGG75_04215 [Bacteroidota bacterium]